MIVLHHAGAHGHSAAVMIALAEKGVSYDGIEHDLARFEQADDAVLQLEATGQLPILVAQGEALTESFFILQYLDEVHPDPPLGGAGPQERYRVAKWGKYCETHVAPNLAIWRWQHLGEQPGTGAAAQVERLPPERRALWRQAMVGFPPEQVEDSRIALGKAAQRLADDLAGRDWLAGSSCSLADIALYPHVAQFRTLGIPVPAQVQAWLTRMAARKAVREAMPDVRLVGTMGPERGRWG